MIIHKGPSELEAMAVIDEVAINVEAMKSRQDEVALGAEFGKRASNRNRSLDVLAALGNAAEAHGPNVLYSSSAFMLSAMQGALNDRNKRKAL